jgi:transposase
MYSEDLKERAIRLYSIVKSYRKVEELLKIGKSTIQRWVKPTNEKTKDKILDIQLVVSTIKKYLDNNKFITLIQIRKKLSNKLNKLFSVSFIYTIIKKTLKYSYKKINKKLVPKSLKYLQHKRKEFIKNIKNIDQNKIICLDESYMYSNHIVNYGWTKIGEPLIHQIKANPIKYSIIMAITNKKIIKTEIYNHNINTKTFLSFMIQLNNLFKDHYFLMDNVSFHKTKGIVELFSNSTNKLLYIPPYSPEFNPIVCSQSSLNLTRGLEEVFSQMKRNIKECTNNNIIKKIKRSVKTTKKEHLENYYNHSFCIK